MRFLGRHLLTACAALALVAFAVPALAQTPSLGDIAKKEQERRKGAKEPKKVYTNDDLKGGGLPSAPPATEARPAEGAPAAATPADGSQPAHTDPAQKDAKSADKDAGAAAAKDEEAWRGRITAARDEQRRNEVFAEALQSRINALTTDFSARDNPVERTQIADERQKALAELQRVKDDIEKNKKKVVEIEEEARKAGVPPGWLR